MRLLHSLQSAFIPALAALGAALCLLASAPSGAAPGDFARAAESAAGRPAGTGAPFGGAPKTVSVELVANRTAGTPRSDYELGIVLHHEPGWHTYWRFAGDTGYPASVQWDLPRRWEATPSGWPIPEKQRTGHLTNFVYSGDVLLPFKLDIPWGTAYGTKGRVKARVEWLACKDVCIPGEAVVSMTVPVEVASKPSEHAALFEAAHQRIPEKVAARHISAVIEDDRIRIDLEPMAGRIDKSIEFFPLKAGEIDFKSLDRMSPGEQPGWTALYLKAHPEYMKKVRAGEIPPLEGVLVADAGPGRGGWAIETSLTPQPGTVTLPWAETETAAAPRHTATVTDLSRGPSLTLVTAVSFAFLGGLILNLMPCVFPVLSLKILQIVDGSRRRGALPVHGVAFTAGVLVTMMVLAVLLIVLRKAGWAIGWGFQLQTPWVVAVLAVLFFAIALNLFGLFEFTAASHLADSRAVRKLPATGPLGSFCSGILAVVVASPCTAPIMGAALGYAILQSDVESVLIFAALGFGMALPWLLLTLVPAWVKLLPRPGAWMVTFKRIMAIPMIAATLWLLWVLSQQVTIYGLLTVLAATGSTAALLWAIGREQYGRGRSQVLKIVSGVATLACLGLLAAGTFDRASRLPAAPAAADAPAALWQPWSEEAVAQALAQGRPVVVDFTAAWCVTCQFNKAATIRTEASEAEITRLNYVRLEADWTNHDARITEVLNKFGRTGVPLYLLYSPDGDTTVLPELLSESTFIEALGKNASGGAQEPAAAAK